MNARRRRRGEQCLEDALELRVLDAIERVLAAELPQPRCGSRFAPHGQCKQVAGGSG
jgi:hypothetical protein